MSYIFDAESIIANSHSHNRQQIEIRNTMGTISIPLENYSRKIVIEQAITNRNYTSISPLMIFL